MASIYWRCRPGAARRRAVSGDAVPDRGTGGARRHAPRGVEARGQPVDGLEARSPRRERIGLEPGCSIGPSTSTCPAVRRSATRHCSSPCSGADRDPRRARLGLDIDALRAYARLIEAETEATADGRGSACWRSRTTPGCCRCCAPITCTSSCAAASSSRVGLSWPTAWMPRGTPRSSGEPEDGATPEPAAVRPGSLDELFASG